MKLTKTNLQQLWHRQRADVTQLGRKMERFRLKPLTWIALWIIALLLPIGIKLLIFPSVTQAAWWNDEWSFRRAISITAHTSPETNVYITVTLNTTDANAWQADCGAGRFFTENGEALPYFIVSGCGTSTTSINVLIPTFPAGAQTLYVYYGNPTAANGFSATNFSSAASGVTLSLGSEEIGPGPYAYWKMDEGGGQAANDSSQNAFNGILGTNTSVGTDDPTWTQADGCISNSCLTFDGSNDFVNLNSHAAAIEGKDAGTVSGWFKASSAEDGDAITLLSITQSSTTQNFWSLTVGNASSSYADESLSFNLRRNNTDTLIFHVRRGHTFYQDNQWHHFAFVTGNGDNSVYVDGIKQAVTFEAGSASTNEFNNINSPNTMRLGSISYGATDTPWWGSLDELKIFLTPLTQEQIITQYANGMAAIMGKEMSQDAANGLAGYWKMNETSGGAADSSGNGSTLTNVNTTPYVPGKYFNAADFESSSSQYQYVADNVPLSITSDVSLSAWIRPESNTAATQYSIAGKWDGADQAYLLTQYGSELRFYLGGSGNYLETTGANLATGAFYQVTGVYQAATQTARIFVNGYEIPTTLTGTIPASLTNGTGRFQVGAINSTTSAADFYDGLIDEVRVYNRTLTPAEVLVLYNWSPGPVGYWKLDENTGSGTVTAVDSSGNNNNATLSNWSNAKWVPGKVGSAGRFQKQGDTMFVTDSATLDTSAGITIAGWVYPHDMASADHYMVNKANEYFIAVRRSFSASVDARLFIDGNYRSLSSSPTLAVNTWQHLALTYDANERIMRFYVNGVLRNSTTLTGLSNYTINNTTQVLEWGGSGGGAQYTGLLDELKVYNYQRNAAEVLEDMNATHPVGGSLVSTQTAFWKMDEQFGTTINNSGNGGTLAGTTSNTTWRTGANCKVNGCLEFNFASNSTVTVTNNFAIDFNDNLVNGYSFSSWVYPFSDGDTTGGAIWQKGTNSFCRFINESAGMLDLQCSFDLATADATLTIPAAVPINTWSHVVMAWANDGDNEITIWIDGVNKGSSTNGSGAPAADTANLSIGGTGTNNFDGRIDEFKIYNTRLTQGEVLIDYNAGAAINFNTGAPPESSQVYGGGGNPAFATWRLDENTGTTANDTSGNGRSGTLQNGPAWVPAKISSGLQFDGSDDYLEISNESAFDFGNNFTIALWVKPAPTQVANATIFSKANNSETGGYGLVMNSTPNSNVYGGGWQNGLGTSCYTDTFALTPNIWSHVTFVKSSTDPFLRMYVNGAQVLICDGTGATDIADTTTSLIFGTWGSAGRRWAGELDMINVYNYVRTPAQIAYDYNRGGPRTWLRLDECQGTTLNDAGSAGNTSSLTVGGSGTQTAVGTCNTASSAWGNGAIGKFNASLNFDGTDDYASFGTPLNPSGDFSLSIWANATSSDTIILVGTNQGNAGLRYINNGNITLHPVGSQTTKIWTGARPPDNEWHHIVVTSDFATKTLTLYVDGQSKGTQNYSDWSLYFNSGNERFFYLARAFSTSANLFQGKLDELQYYTYVLGPDQVKNIFNQQATARFGPESGSP